MNGPSSQQAAWCGALGWDPVNDNRVSFNPCFANTVLLGVPAITASIVIVLRALYLRRHRTPHGLGRAWTIHLPSQLALAVSVFALATHLVSLLTISTPISTLFATGSLIVAWILAIGLNHLESIYSIRSSSILFAFELYSVFVTLAILFSISTQHSQDIWKSAFAIYFYAISTAFFFEALPRDHTNVQQKSDANGHDKANLFSRWIFHYLQPLVSLSYRQPIVMSDIKNIMPEEIKTKHVHDTLAENWSAHKAAVERANRFRSDRARATPSLGWIIAKTFRVQFAALVGLHILEDSLQFIMPLLVQQILDYIETDPEEDKKDPYLKTRGLILALGMFFTSVAVSISVGQNHKKNLEAGFEVRNALISMIYRKALILSPGARRGSTSGQITNHMSTDAEKWTKDLAWVPMWISVPINLSLCTFLLYRIIGWSVFCGLAVVVIGTPLQGWAGRFFDEAGDNRAEAMDSRVRLMTEVLSNIKVIKLYGYESAFKNKVTSYRSKEIALMRKSGVVMALLAIAYSCMPLFIAFISFSVYASVGGPGFTPGVMNAQVVFVSMSLFALLHRPIGSMSNVMESTVSLKVSTRRIQRFLLKEELDPETVQRDFSLPKDPTESLIQISNGTFAWNNGQPADNDSDEDEDSEENNEPDERTPLLSDESSATEPKPVLIDVNVSMARGKLTAIVGRVGQGKSSLLSAIIGDMYKLQGSVKVFGSVAYVPQQAWIINATLRDNIVFGKAFDQQRYDKVLFACGLLPDLEILSDGDLTLIGERGINLSGGQKQRVSLARAAYLNADVYLLDDPLSAVDAHVDQHLWENLVGPEGLLQGKTRVLVTHGIHHLEHVDHILVFKDGRITETGHYKQLMSAKSAFHQLITEFSVESSGSKRHGASDSSANDEDTGTVVEAETGGKNEEDDGDDSSSNEEEIGKNVVSWETFMVYCRAMSYRYFTISMGLYVLWQVLQLSVPIWLEYWTRAYDSTNHSVAYFLIIYAILVSIYMFVDVYVTFVLYVYAFVKASEVLHEKVLARVLHLPMSFFDVTPQGRVLNRFSSDIADIDDTLPESFNSLLACVLTLIGSLTVLTVATPKLIFAFPFIGVMYWIIQKYYFRLSSMLRRMESVAMSPLYQHFGETLNGISSIHAMNISAENIIKNADLSDKSANAFYTSAMANRWLNSRLELLTAITVFISALLAVWNKDTLTPSMAGLALSYTMQMTYHVIWTLRSYCDLLGDLVAVERVHEYSNKRTEAPPEAGMIPQQNWPSQGRIVFKNYSTRYREGLDLVLKNVSLEVKPMEKIGIVGRTGAGKSSLTLALFRIVEAANSYWARASAQEDLPEIQSEDMEDGGSIEIDGIDISTLRLEDLRRHLSIIPQDPTLFAGTVRENLDPFDEVPDAEVWVALERAHLKDYIASLADGLSSEVEQNGENFSVGQRSLICLARALLRKTKILVLDEATAAVDVETDKLIQSTIRSEFKDRTILTIAHRIKTVMDSDKILVLDRGQVAEFDEPKKLLKEKGVFHSLAKQAGEI